MLTFTSILLRLVTFRHKNILPFGKMFFIFITAWARTAFTRWQPVASQRNKDLRKQVLISLCLCPWDTTSFCKFSCKHHFEHHENIIGRKAATKRGCDKSQTVLPSANDVALRAKDLSPQKLIAPADGHMPFPIKFNG